MGKMGVGFLAVVMFAGATGFSLAEAASQQQVVTLDVQGMKAGSAAQVERLLSKLPGVSAVKASEEVGVAVVVYDPAQVQQEEFSRAMQDAGYRATFASSKYSCPHCGAKYSKDGKCIICDVPLEPTQQG